MNNYGHTNPTNPNGGYLKPGQRPDQWYGNLTITSDLFAEIQKTGKLRINVNEVKTNQYGPARRMTAKPFTEVQRPDNQGYNNQPQQYQQQNFGNQAPQQAAPMQQNQGYQQPSQAPMQQDNGNNYQSNFNQRMPNDDIPF